MPRKYAIKKNDEPDEYPMDGMIDAAQVFKDKEVIEHFRRRAEDSAKHKRPKRKDYKGS